MEGGRELAATATSALSAVFKTSNGPTMVCGGEKRNALSIDLNPKESHLVRKHRDRLTSRL